MKINWPVLIILLLALCIAAAISWAAWVYLIDPFLDAIDACEPWADALAAAIATGILTLAIGRKSR